MTLHPATVSDLCLQLAGAHAAGRRVDAVDLSGLPAPIEHTAEDLTVTVQAGTTLSSLNAKLREHGQWLPIDPPHPDATTIGDLLLGNLSGPRRFGFGTVREHLLGLTVVLADGRLIHSGGRVVKNVAGYDLCKVFVGSRGTLGIPVEATFKLLPVPEAELFLKREFTLLGEAWRAVRDILALPITPTILDLHNLNESAGAFTVVIGLAGACEDVQWQRAQLDPFGFEPLAGLDYAERLRPTHCHSVLPSRLAERLDSLEGIPFLARAGNGIVYAQGGPAPARAAQPTQLQQRLKTLFDAKGILPDLPW